MIDTTNEPITDPDHEDAPGADVKPTVTPEEPNGETPEPETFPREYVEDLRKENGKYRQRAQQADDLAKQLHTALVTATGRLADPTDLPFNEDHLSDAESLTAAIDGLLATKPHLGSRKPTGDIGQGATVAADSFSLAGVLRSNAS